MPLEVVTPSDITPWLLGDAKDHLRVRHNEDDGYIQLLTFAIVAAAEKHTRRALFTQTLKLWLDAFPCRDIELQRAPVQSVTSVKYYDTAGVLQTVSTSDYFVDTKSAPGRVVPTSTTVWPSPEWGRPNAVVVEYVAGWTSRGQLPADLKQAMLYHLSHLYDVREPAVIGTIVANIPYTLQALYANSRVRTFY